MKALSSLALALRPAITPSISLFLWVTGCFPIFGAAENQPSDAKAGPKVSYYREVRPILQANCQGCHQPAKSKGGYVMTEFKRLLAGGDNEGAAVIPGHTDKSSILKMITPKDGEVRMPKGKTPLAESDITLITSWIEQGAQDD